MERIKLIESEKLIEILKRYYPFYGDTELYATQDVIDECERRATEKLKEVAKEAYIDGLSARLEGEPFWGFESWWNQFLEEQESSEEKTS